MSRSAKTVVGFLGECLVGSVGMWLYVTYGLGTSCESRESEGCLGDAIIGFWSMVFAGVLIGLSVAGVILVLTRQK